MLVIRKLKHVDVVLWEYRRTLLLMGLRKIIKIRAFTLYVMIALVGCSLRFFSWCIYRGGCFYRWWRVYAML